MDNEVLLWPVDAFFPCFCALRRRANDETHIVICVYLVCVCTLFVFLSNASEGKATKCCGRIFSFSVITGDHS